MSRLAGRIVRALTMATLAGLGLPALAGAQPATFRDGLWSLSGCNFGYQTFSCSSPSSVKVVPFGSAGDLPVVGKWNGGTLSRIGVFRNGLWYLDYNNNGVWDDGVDLIISFGVSGDVPVTGDWNGNGRTKIGVFRNGVWFLDYNGNGIWDGPDVDRMYVFGMAGDIPVVGDWTGLDLGGRTSKIGVFRNGEWYLDFNGNGQWDGAADDRHYTFGQAGDIPIVAGWDDELGAAYIGVFRNGFWFLDANGDGSSLNESGFTKFGGTGDTPVVGQPWNCGAVSGRCSYFSGFVP